CRAPGAGAGDCADRSGIHLFRRRHRLQRLRQRGLESMGQRNCSVAGKENSGLPRARQPRVPRRRKGCAHPPYTSSSEMKMFGGGHSARTQEKELARMLEARQQNQRARFVVFSGHVHNYERHEHGGITYFVTGGAGAHPYPIDRAKDDPFQSKEVNYHYLMVDVDRGRVKITMHRLDLTSGKAVWTEPDSVTIAVPEAKAATLGH